LTVGQPEATIPSGAEAQDRFDASAVRAEQAAEKEGTADEFPEKHTSGANNLSVN
jgi:hypothetical protein